MLSKMAHLVQRHPYSWKIAWELVHKFSILRPHDKSYYALRHFIEIRPDGLFLDVGANDGISAIVFRDFEPSYRIVSIEPNTMLQPALEKIRSSDPNYNYFILGAGDKNSKLAFNVPVYHGVVLHTFTAADPSQVFHALTESFGKKISDGCKINSVASEVVTIDSLSLDPDIIKIDVEGFDFEVLVGAKDTISRKRPLIMIEIDWTGKDQFVSLFENIEYSMIAYNIAEDKFDTNLEKYILSQSGHRNLFAVPNEELSKLPFLGDGLNG